MPKRKTNKFLFSGKSRKNLQKSLLKKLKRINPAGIFLLLSVIFFLAWGLYQVHIQKRLSFDSDVVFALEIANRVATPVRMQISSLGINLPVKQTIIQDGVWQISEEGISHLAVSAYPGQKQNGIYYGHNTTDRFGNLHTIRIGDKILVLDQQNRKYTYQVYDVLVVYPSDMEALLAYNGETITLYTCTGFADTQRLLVKAERVR